MKRFFIIFLLAIGIGCYAQQPQKVNIANQTIAQIRANMPTRIEELDKLENVTFFEDGKEISGPEALTLAKKVRDGERDMILSTISGSKTPAIWANVRSITINKDYSFSMKYKEEYPGKTNFE